MNGGYQTRGWRTGSVGLDAGVSQEHFKIKE